MYRWFCENILWEVVGNRQFTKICEYEPITKFITISDEAFALVCFKNYYEAIKDKVLQSLKDNNSQTQNELEKDDIPTLYTKAGAVSKKKSSTACYKYSGWTYEGIEEYNKLFDQVKLDRKNYMDFDNYFMGYIKKKLHDKKRNDDNNVMEEFNIVTKTCWDEANL